MAKASTHLFSNAWEHDEESDENGGETDVDNDVPDVLRDRRPVRQGVKGRPTLATKCVEPAPQHTGKKTEKKSEKITHLLHRSSNLMHKHFALDW